MIDHPSASATAAQAQYGFEGLGPLIAFYLHDLHAVLERLARQRGARTLYVAPGGLLIGEALQAYRAAAGIATEAAEHAPLVSRLLAAKGAWKRAPAQALKVLDRELHSATAGDYARRVVPGIRVDPSEDALPFASFSDFMATNGRAAAACRTELEQQADLFEHHFAGVMGEDGLGVLVDTGWRGTTLAVLSHAYPEYELWGANFARHDDGNIDPRVHLRLMGVGFDSNDYDPAKPLSALIFHRRLIESLFEPVGPSIERLERRGQDVEPIGADSFAAGRMRPLEAGFFDGVLRYVREVAPTLSYGGLERARNEAAERLANDILFPSAETARLLGGQSTETGPVLQEPSRTPGDDPEARIRSSPWPQGQLALECRPAVARERQRILLPKTLPSRAAAAQGPDPKVAIIMRTMDRVIFLRRAFDSIARQTFGDYVLVVFNDGGDVDEVEAELEASRLDRRRVLLLDGVENRGMEAASNAAIAAVRSEYVVIHDDDDTWNPHFLSRTVSYLDANPRTGGVVTRSLRVDEEISGDRVRVVRTKPYNDWLRSVQLGELLIANAYPPISFLFRRSVYEEVGGFNEHLPVLGDWDFNVRVAARAEIGVIPELLAQYHHRLPGGAAAYANTVTGGISLHERFNAVVRSGFVSDGALSPLAGAIALGPVLQEIRAGLRRLTRSQAAPPAPRQAETQALIDAADDRWCMLAYLRRREPGASAAEDVTVSSALAWAAKAGIPTPPDFDEAAYLRENPDVRPIVETGDCRSGYLHYVLRGRAEGRRRPTLAVDAGARS